MKIIAQTQKDITVCMSLRMWNRMQKADKICTLVRKIERAKKQAETAPSMTPEEGLHYIKEL